jgi:hypothetical protein
MRVRIFGVIALAVLALLVAPARAAAGATPTLCPDGTILSATFVDDLVVAASTTCHLHRVSIGDGITATGPAELIAVDSSLSTMSLSATALRMSHSSSFVIDETGAAQRIWIGHSSVYALEVGPVSNGGVSTPVLMMGSTVENDVVVSGAPTVNLNTLHIGNVLDIYNSGHLDLSQTGVVGDAFLQYLGDTQVCGVSIGGSVRIAGQLAGTTASFGGLDGSACNGQFVVNGDLTVTANVGSVVLNHVIVRGKLICQGNTQAPVLVQVSVSGSRSGQCART